MSNQQELNNQELNNKVATISQHLAELRLRLLYSIVAFFVVFIACYCFSKEIYAFLVEPLAKIYGGESGRKLIYTGLSEAFMTYVQVAFYAALFFSFPVFASQIYIFLAPGLYKKEKMVLLPYLFATPVLFTLGAAMAYYFVFPVAWKFFASFETPAGEGGMAISLEARVSEYLSLVISMIFAFGMAFQLPVVLTLLARVGFIDSAFLKKKRKYSLIIILTVAAIFTPPDVMSQIALATPMYLLYELSIISCGFVESKETASTTGE